MSKLSDLKEDVLAIIKRLRGDLAYTAPEIHDVKWQQAAEQVHTAFEAHSDKPATPAPETAPEASAEQRADLRDGRPRRQDRQVPVRYEHDDEMAMAVEAKPRDREPLHQRVIVLEKQVRELRDRLEGYEHRFEQLSVQVGRELDI